MQVLDFLDTTKLWSNSLRDWLLALGIAAALLLIDTIRRLHPQQFQFTGATAQSPNVFWIDRLAGTAKVRRAMEAAFAPSRKKEPVPD